MQLGFHTATCFIGTAWELGPRLEGRGNVGDDGLGLPQAVRIRLEPMADSWIVSDPEVLGGKPCVRGTRLSVELLLELLSQGATPQQILDMYPYLPPAGLQAALD